MKSIVICADDYGLNESVNNGIRKLIIAKRLSAVSCMTNSPSWPNAASDLIPYRNSINVGLHFNLTHNFYNNKHINLIKLIIKSQFRVIDKKWIINELNAQLDNFEKYFGYIPDFIDGHHHIHVFPQIREIVFSQVNKRYGSNAKIWLRRVNPKLTNHDAKLKALLLKFLAYNFDKGANKAGFALSGDFAGLYSLTSKADYPAMMKNWLLDAKNSMLIMCHPGLGINSKDKDESMLVRDKEYHFFNSTQFTAMCDAHNISITKLNLS